MLFTGEIGSLCGQNLFRAEDANTRSFCLSEVHFSVGYGIF